jgi:adenine-specific DNA-methyltransferase
VTGRLTLTWANKDRALLSHGESGYEWVDRDDPRAREVRLLDEVDRVGEVAGDASDNLLIRGDSLDALRALVHTPELAAEYRGKVKLVYIDPPFNTGQAFEHYDDSLEHSVWLGMMRERLVLIKELLSPEGSVWVHLDDAEMAYCKVLMDEIFGRQNFVATVVWEKADSPRNDAAEFSSRHDSILVFKKSTAFRLQRLVTEETAAHYRNVDSDGRRYYTKPLRAMAGKDSSRAARPSMFFPIEAPDGSQVYPKLPDGGDGRWRWGQERVEAERHRIEWVSGRKGWSPYYRIYADDAVGVPPETLWPHTEVGSNRTSKLETAALFRDQSFDTPKPEKLMEKILLLASSGDDIVLDCFAGSGTTAAVAHKMGRRWVTVELNEKTADTFTKPRLAKVVAGDDPGGITESAGWLGGGGFRDLRIAPSAWEVHSADDDLDVYRAESASTETLTRSVAAQLGYRLIDDPVFSGARGRSRLAVIDGVADATAVTDIAAALAEGQTALVAATSVTDDAQTTLRDLSKGSRVLRIPRDLFPRTGAVTR